LQAVRSGKWKLYLPLEKRFTNLGRRATRPSPPALYDVVADPGETRDLAEHHPDTITRLTALAEIAREDLGGWDRPGKNTRPVGKIDGRPQPRLIESE
jgi:hypothetical protein